MVSPSRPWGTPFAKFRLVKAVLEPMSSTRFTILCVDDEDLQLEARKLLFEEEGFHFLGARKSAEALDLFRSREIHAVVLDYWMSGKNGLVLAEEMKKERPDTPIIMLSGFV